jgi:hypothetical protein
MLVVVVVVDTIMPLEALAVPVGVALEKATILMEVMELQTQEAAVVAVEE